MVYDNGVTVQRTLGLPGTSRPMVRKRCSRRACSLPTHADLAAMAIARK
jgi:hypothetical protein